MTYEIGQKILIEVTVQNPEIDKDGEIRVCFRDNPDDWDWVSAANTREIPAEPTPIAFGDVRVGDNVRVVRRSGVDSNITTGIVSDVWSNRFSVVGSDRHVWTDGFYSIELISRPEPEPIKVDDKILIEQVRTLPVGSVVDCGAPRTVSLNGLFNAKDDTTYGWHNYGGLLRDFTVKYIAGQA